MKITAKFKVDSILKREGSEQVKLVAVYSPDPKSDNYTWSKYTPSGELNMVITNPEAKFEVGESYILTFDRV